MKIQMKTLKNLSLIALTLLTANAFAQDGELPSDQLAATSLHLTGGLADGQTKVWFIDGKRYDHNPFYLTAIGHGYCVLSFNLNDEEATSFNPTADLAIQPASFVKKTRTGGLISVVKYPVQNGTLTCVGGIYTLSLKIKNIRYNLGNELVLGE